MEDTDNTCLPTTSTAQARRDRIAALFRAAINGGPEALGDFCEAFRPAIFFRVRCYLSTWHIESETEDLVQDVLCELVEAFPRISPSYGNLHALVKTITLHTIYAFMKRERILLKSVQLPDNDDAEDHEYLADPLDMVAREAWERDSLPVPVSMANKHKPHRLGRAATAKKKARAKEKELQSRPGSGNYKRNKRKISAWDLKRIEKERTAFAQALSSTAAYERMGIQ